MAHPGMAKIPQEQAKKMSLDCQIALQNELDRFRNSQLTGHGTTPMSYPAWLERAWLKHLLWRKYALRGEIRRCKTFSGR